MSRIAAWRRGPNDPATAREWLFRSGLVLKRIHPRALARPFAISVLIAGVATLVIRAHPKYAGMIAPIGVGAANFLIERTRPRRKHQPEEPPGPGEAFEVAIVVRDVHGIATGRDQGWLIFSEGWVLFEGARTDFAITRGESYRKPHEMTLALKLEDGRTVAISPLGEPPLPRRLNRAFNAWEVASIPDGEAVLPPREAHPAVWVERHSLGVYGTVAAAIFVGFGVKFGDGLVIAGASVLLLACLGYAAKCSRRLRASLPQGLAPASSMRHELAEAKR